MADHQLRLHVAVQCRAMFAGVLPVADATIDPAVGNALMLFKVTLGLWRAVASEIRRGRT